MTTAGRSIGRRAKSAVLLPLGLVSAACTIDLCTAASGPTSSQVSLTAATVAPSVTALSAPPFSTPATTTAGGVVPVYLPPVRLTKSPATAGVTPAVSASSLRTAPGDIPAVALAAYQRAATVIDTADTSCHLSWQLLAGIGRVESDHGRTEGNTLTADGVATPGIFGPVLTGKNATSRVLDTDGGVLDGDKRYDRAVGPMQFIPSTWAMVAVDANGDGKRDPQNIDDAALGAAAYLCAGDADLATAKGQRQAVLRYNHSWSYVHTVLSLAADYGKDTGTSLDTTVPAVSTTPKTHHHHHELQRPSAGKDRHGSAARNHRSGVGSPGSKHPAPVTNGHHTPSTPTSHPSPTGGSATGPGTGTKPGSGSATGSGTTSSATPATPAELTDLCTNGSKGANGAKGADGTDTMDGIVATYPNATADALAQAETYCVQQLTGKTLADAKTALPDLIAQLPTQFPDLTPTAPVASPSPTPTTSPSASASPTTPAAPAQP